MTFFPEMFSGRQFYARQQLVEREFSNVALSCFIDTTTRLRNNQQVVPDGTDLTGDIFDCAQLVVTRNW
jgi:hypothetical protein